MGNENPFRHSRLRLPASSSMYDWVKDVNAYFDNGKRKDEIHEVIFGPTENFLSNLYKETGVLFREDSAKKLGIETGSQTEWVVFYNPSQFGLFALGFPESIHPNRRTLDSATSSVCVEYQRRGLEMVPSEVRTAGVVNDRVIATHYRLVDDLHFLLSADIGFSGQEVNDAEKGELTQHIGVNHKEKLTGTGFVTDNMLKISSSIGVTHIDNPVFRDRAPDEELIHHLLKLNEKAEYAHNVGIRARADYSDAHALVVDFDPQRYAANMFDINPHAKAWQALVPLRL